MSTKDPYYKWFQANCNSVDFRTFSSVKNQVLKYLNDSRCPVETKLLFGTFLLKTIYMMYKFRGPDKTDVVNSLIKPIEICKNVISKGKYLHYHDAEASSMIALHFYLNRFKEKDTFFILQLMNDVQLVKNYLQRGDINDEELLEHFLSWVERSPVDEQRSNILDVLLRHYPKDMRVIALHKKMQFGENARTDVYNDAQNVHDEEISAAVLNAAENLMDWGEEHPLNLPPSVTGENPVMAWAEGILYSQFHDPKERQIIECCMKRCAIDTTCFGTGFNIADIFYTTLHYITLSPNSASIYPIFMEEMDNMKELCSSGYVARCMTALQGQEESGAFDIVIPFSKKLHALISMKLAEMDDASENVVLGTYDPEFRKYYLEYVCSKVNKYLPHVIESNDLKDVVENITEVLHKLTESEWTFNPDTKEVSYVYVEPEKPKETVFVDPEKPEQEKIPLSSFETVAEEDGKNPTGLKTKLI